MISIELEKPRNLTELKRKFRFWHVEAILNQTADLFDRCLTEVTELNGLDYTKTQFELDLESEQKDLDLDKARKDYLLRDVISTGIRQPRLDQMGIWTNNAKNEADKLYTYYNNRNNPNDLEFWKAGQNVDEANSRFADQTLAKELNLKNAEWAASDSEYSANKMKLREETLKAKVDLSSSGYPLDLSARMTLIKKRLVRDLMEIGDRIAVAREGLKLIYGYEKDLQDLGSGFEPVFTSRLLWVRDAIQWLIGYGQLDQSFTSIISFKSVIGHDGMAKLRAAKDEYSTSFTIPDSLFSNHENIRLRGMSAALLGQVGIIPWSLLISLPKQGVYVRDETKITIDQAQLPSCLLGRVESRNSYRSSEICGLVSLMNASPIGETRDADGFWLLKVIKPIGSEEDFAKIDDIILELTLTGQPVK